MHKKANFDHALYAQAPAADVRMAWEESSVPAFRYMDIPKTKGTVRPTLHLYRKLMEGEFGNEDIAVASDPVLGGQKSEDAEA